MKLEIKGCHASVVNASMFLVSKERREIEISKLFQCPNHK